MIVKTINTLFDRGRNAVGPTRRRALSRSHSRNHPPASRGWADPILSVSRSLHLVEEIKQFFVNYNELRGRKFKPLAEAGPRAAEKIIDTGMKTFKKQNGRSK